MYETMVAWTRSRRPATVRSRTTPRIWQSTDKIVYSRTRGPGHDPEHDIVRDLDPDAVRRLKTSDRDITVGGADLAAQTIGAGLVDECHLFLTPILVGGGGGRCPITSASTSN